MSKANAVTDVTRTCDYQLYWGRDEFGIRVQDVRTHCDYYATLEGGQKQKTNFFGYLKFHLGKINVPRIFGSAMMAYGKAMQECQKATGSYALCKPQP